MASATASPESRFGNSPATDIANIKETRSLLSCRDSDDGNSTTTGTNHQTRRRVSGKSSSLPACIPRRQQSLSREIGHAAAETYLITRLSFKLLSLLGLGYRWISRLLGLACYAMLLMPGFLQVAYYYCISPQVRRSIVYGDQPRNRLDLHLPSDSGKQKPVVIFVTGGAWIIGYKAWGALLGKQLAERGVVVACLDYRNFPQGTISDMVNDVSQGISYVCDNISDYGGDTSRIYLMGQSAGAHILTCALLDQAIKQARGDSILWSISQINAYFGLSGGYNLLNLVEHFNNRGLYKSIFLSIMEGEKSLAKFSPEIVVRSGVAEEAVSLLPPILLFHGSMDVSIPPDASKDFVECLKSAGAQAELVLYDGKTHTDLFLQYRGFLHWLACGACVIVQLYVLSPLQDPLRGGKDDLFDHVFAFIHSGDEEALAKDAVAPPRRRLVPELLLKLARKISPF